MNSKITTLVDLRLNEPGYSKKSHDQCIRYFRFATSSCVHPNRFEQYRGEHDADYRLVGDIHHAVGHRMKYSFFLDYHYCYYALCLNESFAKIIK